MAPGLRVLPPHRGPSRGGPLKAPPKVLSAQVTLWLPFYIENTSSNAPPTHHSVYLSVVFFFFFFGPHPMACRILVPQPGIETMPPAVEASSPTYWITRDIPVCPLFERLVFLSFWGQLGQRQQPPSLAESAFPGQKPPVHPCS